MSFNYDGLAKTALGILRQFGGPGTLKKRAASARDPNTATVGMVETSHPVTVVALDLTEAQRENSATLKLPRRFLIGASGLAVAIDNEDTLVVDGHAYKIKNPGAVAPAGTVVVYDAVVES